MYRVRSENSQSCTQAVACIGSIARLHACARITFIRKVIKGVVRKTDGALS